MSAIDPCRGHAAGPPPCRAPLPERAHHGGLGRGERSCEDARFGPPRDGAVRPRFDEYLAHRNTAEPPVYPTSYSRWIGRTNAEDRREVMRSRSAAATSHPQHSPTAVSPLRPPTNGPARAPRLADVPQPERAEQALRVERAYRILVHYPKGTRLDLLG